MVRDERDPRHPPGAVDEQPGAPERPVEGQPGGEQVGRRVEQRPRGTLGVARGLEPDGQLVDEAGQLVGPGLHPHGATRARRRHHQPLAEPGHGRRAPQEQIPHLLRRRAVAVVEDEQGADRHRDPPPVDGELEHVVRPRPVDRRAW